MVLACLTFAASCNSHHAKGDDDSGGDDDVAPPITTKGFQFIPHGVFIMGSPEGEVGRRGDETQHQVTLTRDFEMLAYEVPQNMYESTMGFNPSRYPLIGPSTSQPVNNVSFFDALAFTNVMSRAYGYPECYSLNSILCVDATAGDSKTFCRDHFGIASAVASLNGIATPYECGGFRLPTESEWEYGARAGTTTAVFSGDITVTGCSPLDPNLDAIAWYCANANTVPQNVIQKRANGFGLYDTSGNVAEWTWDWYVKDYPGIATDPQGPDSGYFKVVRGGSAKYDGGIRLRSAYREAHTQDYRTGFIGFRVARTLSAPFPADDDSAEGGPAAPLAAAAKPTAPAPTPKSYPDHLPFTFTRPDVGTPLTAQEVSDFTAKITGFWKDTNHFHWLSWISHGMTADNPDGMPDFKILYNDIQAIKAGDTVTFQHTGGDDNLTIDFSKEFNVTAAAYLESGDPFLGQLLQDWCKGYVALFMGMIWGPADADPEQRILPRNILIGDNDYVEEGRKHKIEWGPAKHPSDDWNAKTFENPYNPYWGDIWIRSMRSQDDVPHIYRAVPMMMRLSVDAQDENVRNEAARSLSYLQSFASDVVDSGYFIRTKNRTGNTEVPLNPDGTVADLASFVEYDPLIKNCQCNAKLASSLIAYADPLGLDCGNGIGSLYEMIATMQHYYNWEIIRYFHVSALTNALMANQKDVALNLLKGMALRVDQMIHDDASRAKIDVWDADGASYLVTAAVAGLPFPQVDPTCGCLTLIFTRVISATDIFYIPEAASDPGGPWSTDGVTEVVIASNGTTQPIQASDACNPASIAGERFMHLRITRFP